jgi:hypothetical protein
VVDYRWFWFPHWRQFEDVVCVVRLPSYAGWLVAVGAYFADEPALVQGFDCVPRRVFRAVTAVRDGLNRRPAFVSLTCAGYQVGVDRQLNRRESVAEDCVAHLKITFSGYAQIEYVAGVLHPEAAGLYSCGGEN